MEEATLRQLQDAAVAELLEYVPRFHITMLGPFISSRRGEERRVEIEVLHLVVPSSEEAIATALGVAEVFCGHQEIPYEPEEWMIYKVDRCQMN